MAYGRIGLTGVSAMAVIAALAATPAAAQDAPVEADAGSSDGVQEIIVTALRREQSLQDVPLAISAISGQTLQDAGVIGVDGIAALVPSLALVANNQPLAQSYRIRGLGSDPNIPTFEPSVALFIDGVYMPRSGLGVEDLVDIERVEVLKGPQSTLYGKNATAGVISVVSAQPSGSFKGSVEGTVSLIDGGRTPMAYRLAASLSGPITDRLRARVTGVYYHAGASFKNLTGAEQPNEMKRYAVRGQLEFDVTDTVLLNITAARSEVLPNNSTNSDWFRGLPTELSFALDNNAALNTRFGVTACPDNNPTNRVICTTDPNRSSSETDFLSATLTADLGFATLTSITGWSAVSTSIRPSSAVIVAARRCSKSSPQPPCSRSRRCSPRRWCRGSRATSVSRIPAPARNISRCSGIQQAGVLSSFGTTSGFQNYLAPPRQVGVTARMAF